MAFTNQVTVNALGDTNIVIQGDTATSVVVGEDPGVIGWPTSDFLVKKGGSSVYVRVPAGQSYEFKAGRDFFINGQTVGQLKLPNGASATTFDVDESSR